MSDEKLAEIFEQAGKNKGPIQIKGTTNEKPYLQTLVKYKGTWHLYVNMVMLKDSPKRIGENIEFTVAFDPEERIIEMHPKLLGALNEHTEAKMIFDTLLQPSLKKEIVRYIPQLKSEESLERNIIKAINFLLGKGRFVGRNTP